MSEKTFIHEDNIFSSLILKNEKDIISQKTNLYTEEELLNLLSEQIQHLMVHDREQLWSLFYRLDITDESLRFVLSNTPSEQQSIALAKLVLERQKKRMETKLKYKQAPIEDEEWRSW
ncbi:MAG: hypothetical protein NWS66_00040 [Saprospiraceae bacterium]|jgi:hypothetical protein|nr:hypothetical protein [Saprospiraceae bacterium]MDP4698302.1 hypothetical protein [Saprospiraceae bacterium]MDP4812295.1 hypothetical protein [Saprospiraceae bacterium]MDP4813000.1 hypothetical protein [Saprospiraceae bacterium]MDP4912758.1 hypothetical protein [Saprospiraceae bacterium]